MPRPVVHFEIIGEDPQALRNYYSALFEWDFDVSGTVAPAVSASNEYGFTDPGRSSEGAGIPGGVGGGPTYESRALFYVGVPAVEVALAEAERLGGSRLMGPQTSPSGLVVAHFRDPAGNVIGLAGPE